MPELVIQISEKANRLLEAYKESTGLGDNARVVEEALYTIYELLKLEKERSKTEPTVPASEFIDHQTNTLPFFLYQLVIQNRC